MSCMNDIRIEALTKLSFLNFIVTTYYRYSLPVNDLTVALVFS